MEIGFNFINKIFKEWSQSDFTNVNSEISEIRSAKYLDFALSSFCYTGGTDVT